jgi:hypothetical protein
LLPWEIFLGHAAHRLIGYMYGVKHPANRVYYNTDSLSRILEEVELGDASRLLPEEQLLRPDITDISDRHLFEIKPRNKNGLQEGRRQARAYLVAMNRAMPPGISFKGGTGFTGATYILFGDGCHGWRLDWENLEPGILLYHWRRTRQCFQTAAEAHAAGEWMEITLEEMAAYGGWVAHAVEGMVWRREALTAFSAKVGIVVEVAGMGSVAIFSAAIFGRPTPRSIARQPPIQPPTQGSGKVLPFPPRKLPSPAPREVPKASGM